MFLLPPPASEYKITCLHLGLIRPTEREIGQDSGNLDSRTLYHHVNQISFPHSVKINICVHVYMYAHYVIYLCLSLHMHMSIFKSSQLHSLIHRMIVEENMA